MVSSHPLYVRVDQWTAVFNREFEVWLDQRESDRADERAEKLRELSK